MPTSSPHAPVVERDAAVPKFASINSSAVETLMVSCLRIDGKDPTGIGRSSITSTRTVVAGENLAIRVALVTPLLITNSPSVPRLTSKEAFLYRSSKLSNLTVQFPTVRSRTPRARQAKIAGIDVEEHPRVHQSHFTVAYRD